MGHFLLLSDYLTRNGCAVLRYDKRGVGESEGDYGSANTFNFADDTRSAIAYLKTRPEIDQQIIGLLGHSEGALIAPIIASENKEGIAFIIMMGWIGVSGTELLLKQAEIISRINGIPEEQIVKTTQNNSALYEIAISEASDSLLAEKMKQIQPELVDNMIHMLFSPSFGTFLSIDFDDYISKVTCPILAMTGENDVQCPPEQNLTPLSNP